MSLIEKASYIKGLADGLDLNDSTKEGKIIKALIGLFPLIKTFRFARLCNIGIEKAAVLPVPVCAQPNRSAPASRGGIA